MSHDYYVRSMNALQLAGLSEGTQHAYTRAVRKLVEFYGRPPEKISETELEEYFLHRRNVDKWSPSTLAINYSGVRFFFRNVLKRDWHIFTYLKARKAKGLPSILDREEVHKIFSAIRTFHNYTCLAAMYSCGLRTSEALALEIADIDSQRDMLHVHRGKGAKDRYVPLPAATLHLLRRYWRTHRHPTLLFPAFVWGCRYASPIATKTMSRQGVQNTFREVVSEVGITKRRVTPHTLRHCYATHLLEAGVNARLVQQYMGHTRLETTSQYLHFTNKGAKDAYRIINDTMNGFQFRHE